MQFLLDTHTFLWFIEGNAQLSSTARSLIENSRNERLISYASLWEIAIKVSIDKLELHVPFDQIIPLELHRNAIETLDFTVEHVNRVAILPFHHRDPFDRMLAAQALVENIPILSADSKFDAYGVNRLWR